LTQGDITEQITILPARSVDAILHDPPRFGIAGELYSQAFYDELARVIRRGGRLLHYTGTPNRLTSQRNVPLEVARRLRHAGFATQLDGDGVLAIRGAAVRREAHPAATQFRVTSHYVRLAAAVLNSAKTLPHRFRCYPRMCPPSH
jgi:hypothetical protein